MVAESPTVLKARWSRPTIRGRSDLYYTVEYSDPDNRGKYLLSANLHGDVTMLRIPAMRPNTQYCVRVTAKNGVSDQDENQNHLRVVELCVETPQDGESLTHGNTTISTYCDTTPLWHTYIGAWVKISPFDMKPAWYVVSVTIHSIHSLIGTVYLSPFH